MTIFHERMVRNLKRYRRMCGLSQQKLAIACSLSGNYVAEIEMGRKFPSADTMQRFVHALNIDPQDLFSAEIVDRGVPMNGSENFSYRAFVNFINESVGKYVAERELSDRK